MKDWSKADYQELSVVQCVQFNVELYVLYYYYLYLYPRIAINNKTFECKNLTGRNR